MKQSYLDPEFMRRLETLSFAARRVHRKSETGQNFVFRRGSSLEFQDYRAYNHGDDLRTIDWNVYRRHRRLVIKLFAAEEDMSVHLLLDTSRSMDYGGKFTYARRLAAALGYIGLHKLDRVGAASFSDRLGDRLPPRRGRSGIHELFAFLDAQQPVGQTAFSSSLVQYARMNRSPGLAVIISDLMDPAGYREGLLALAHNRYDILLLHVLSDDEIEPPAGGPVTLRDMELNITQQTSLGPDMTAIYAERFAEYTNGIAGFCVRHGMEYVRTSTSIPFEDVVLSYLREGKYLH